MEVIDLGDTFELNSMLRELEELWPNSGRFVVTHPFHPLSGQEFELVGYAHTWGDHPVFYRKPGEELVRSIPAHWTDVERVDPFVVL